MKRPNITPGPWVSRDSEMQVHGSSNIYSDKKCICVGCDDAPKDQVEANTKAIAAVPAMLSALEWLHAWLEAPDTDPDSLVWAQGKAKEALIKAGYTF